MRNIWRVIQLIPEYRGRVVGVILVSLLTGSIAGLTPYIYKAVVDVIARLGRGALSPAAATSNIVLLVSALAVLRLFLLLLSWIQEKQAGDLWLDNVGMLRQRVFENMMRLSIDYYERTRLGEIMDRFGTITTITLWLRALVEGNLANMLQMLIIVAVLASKAPWVSLIMSALLVFNVYVSYRTVRVTKPLRRAWERLAGKLGGLLAEMIGSIATVRSFAGEASLKDRYDGTQKDWKGTRTDLHKVERLSNLVLNSVNGFAVVGAIAILAHGALQGRYSAGDILLVLTLSQNLITSIAPITRLINQTGDIETAAERLVELLDVEPTVVDRPDAIDLGTIEVIEFENVSFAYPNKQRDALHDISFRLEAGKTLALVGLSGAGKTTIVKLILRFYDPTGGRILVNGLDIRQYRQESLRNAFGVVLQDVALFNDTIEENIAFARRGAEPEEITAAAEAAHADVFIRNMPDGYQTMVGERGIKLSGGEKQRVAIARAILKNPQLIILDEATSALDSQSERLVQDGLKRLMEGRMAVIIAHRLSTIRNADQILVMESGTVVEYGHHSVLAGRQGLYARLNALQSQPLALSA